MRILVDINHPAHVHLFRNAIKEWRDHGHQVLITARDKEVTLELLRRYGLEYVRTAGVRRGVLALPFGVVELDWKIWRAARRFDPDVMVGSSFAIAHVSRLLRGRSIVTAEDSLDASRLFWAITKPFTDAIVIPDSVPDDFGPRQVKYPSYHELAYLHPQRFKPDSRVLREEGLRENEPFSLLRFVSFGASHDLRQSGIDAPTRMKLMELLGSKGRVVINSEGPLPADLERFRMRTSPDKLHHLLAFAQLLVSDSQTTTIEAAVLGTPSVRFNSFVGRTPVIEELEQRYQLTFGFKPPQQREMLNQVEAILSTPKQDAKWRERRKRMLADKIDLTDWMVDFIEKAGTEIALKSAEPALNNSQPSGKSHDR